MVMRALVLAVVLIAVTPAPGRAVTIDDLVALSRQGVADTVMVAVIDADRTVFHLTSQQVATLKKQGVPDAVVVKMLGSAREFTEPDVAPHVVIIGHEPPQPEAAPPAEVIVAVPFVVAVPSPVRRPAARQAPAPPPAAGPTWGAPVPPAGGFGRFINDGWIDGVGFGRFINDGSRAR